MEGPPTAWDADVSLTNESADAQRSRGIESNGLAGDVFITATLPPQRCPSHKSPNQPSRMSPIYFTSQFVILGAASLPASSPPSFRLLYWVLTRHVLRAPDAGTWIDGLLRVITFLRGYKVLSFSSPRRDSDDPASRISILVWSPREDRREKRKKVIRQRNQRLPSQEIESGDTRRISSGLPRAGNSTRLDTTLCIFSRTRITWYGTGVKHY